jgi:hypothetical protein
MKEGRKDVKEGRILRREGRRDVKEGQTEGD